MSHIFTSSRIRFLDCEVNALDQTNTYENNGQIKYWLNAQPRDASNTNLQKEVVPKTISTAHEENIRDEANGIENELSALCRYGRRNEKNMIKEVYAWDLY